MDRQNNQQSDQPEQNTNVNQSQQSGLSGLFFPLNFIFREGTEHGNPQQNDSQEQQPQAQQEQQPQAQQEQIPQFLHFFTYPMPGTQEGGNANSGVFFFMPLFMPQQEIRKPRASESAMKMLPIVTLTKEHVDTQMSCPICLEPFSLSIGQEDKTEINQQKPVRQMPCNHIFCEPCLFQWLRQNNSCPLCRIEIKAEEAEPQQQEVNNDARLNIPLFGIINIAPSPSSLPSTSTSNETTINSNSRSSHRSTISCSLASVGCCEEVDNDTQTSIITLPQCHHRFHASCLRTSLLVEGYPPGDFNSISQPLSFHCPTCRAPAIVQSDMLKTPHEQQQFNIQMPDSGDMDLD